VPAAKHDPIAVDTFERNAPTDQDREEDSKRRDQVCVRDCKRSYPRNGGNAADYRQCPHGDYAIAYCRKALRACPHAFDYAVVMTKRTLDKLFFLFHKTSSSYLIEICSRPFQTGAASAVVAVAFWRFWDLEELDTHDLTLVFDRRRQKRSKLVLGVCWRLVFVFQGRWPALPYSVFFFD
jgi:hypothetical protein